MTLTFHHLLFTVFSLIMIAFAYVTSEGEISNEEEIVLESRDLSSP